MVEVRLLQDIPFYYRLRYPLRSGFPFPFPLVTILFYLYFYLYPLLCVGSTGPDCDPHCVDLSHWAFVCLFSLCWCHRLWLRPIRCWCLCHRATRRCSAATVCEPPRRLLRRRLPRRSCCVHGIVLVPSDSWLRPSRCWCFWPSGSTKV